MKSQPLPPKMALPPSLNPMVTDHPASHAYAIATPGVCQLSWTLEQMVEICRALVQLDRERVFFRCEHNGGTWNWVEEAGRQH